MTSNLAIRIDGLQTPTLADKLPAAARTKLLALTERAATALTLVQAATAKQNKRRNEYLKAAAMHGELEDDFKRGFVIREDSSSPIDWNLAPPHLFGNDGGERRALRGPDEQRMEKSRADLAALKAEVDRQTEKVEALTAAWHVHQGPISAIEKYLFDVRSARLTDAKPVQPDRRKAASPAAVEQVRATIDALKGELADVRAAPIPSADAKAAARELVEQLASQGAPKLFDLSFDAFHIEFPKVMVRNEGSGRADGGGVVHMRGFSTQVDPAALLAWLDPEKMVSALERDIDEIADDKSALDNATRAFREDELETKILAAEREEETIIEMVIASGIDVARRGDADPRAVLCIDGPAPVEA